MPTWSLRAALVLAAAASTLAQDNLREKIEGSLPRSWSNQLTWRSIGPANMGGRITSLAVHPSDRSAYWIGSSGGGLLKTTNNGLTYEHQFSNENTNSIGAVAVAPSNGDHVWIGTGENNPRNSVSWGDGVYRSTDGGATWEHAGLSESFQISTVIVHPDDTETVFVGACGRLWGESEQRGLYKTTDGGKSWEKILSIDNKTGVIDIRLKPDNPDVLLAATYERERDIYCSNDPAKKWGPGSGLWRSEDGGKSWVKVTEGLPTVTMGRIGLDWYAKDPSVVYAVIETELITQEPADVAFAGLSGEDAEVGARLTEITEEGPAAEAGLKKGDVIVRAGETTIVDFDAFGDLIKAHKAGDKVSVDIVREGEAQTLELTFGNKPKPEDNTDELGYPRSGPFSGGLGGQRQNIQGEQGENGHDFGGIFRSEDAGKTWSRINSLNPRPMYYSEIRVDPSDDNYVYVLGTSLYRSEDGGKTFTSDGASRDVHVDHHDLWIDPHDGRHMILGNDGGIYVTWDRMAMWDHHNHVAIGQFYNVTCGPRADYMVYGGLQDNGSWGGPSRSADESGPINTDWFNVGGGDGFVCRVDANDPDLVYYESQNGGMGRRNLATGEGGFVRPRGGRDEPRYRFNWNTPFILSSHNSRIHYSAGNYVFRSLDRGNRARRISPDVTTTERGSATSLHESPVDSDVLYVGTDDGGLWMTKDGGHTWTDLFELNAGIEPPAKAEKAAFRHPPVALKDPLTGTWTCKAQGEGIESEEQGNFTLKLTLDEGKVSGEITSDIGDGELAGLRWNEEEGELRFRFQGDNLALDFEVEVDGEEMEGEINAAGGAFSFDFTGKRTSAPEAEDTPEPEEDEQGEEPAEEEAKPDEKPDEEPEEEADEEEPEPAFKKDTIDQLLEGRMYVSSITASRHKDARVYVTFDGHRSDDDGPHVFVSNDHGQTWESLRNNLTDGVGSVRDLDEDLENEDVLYLGTEFGAFVSIDKGDSWTELGANLPTVAVHDFAQHSTRGELIAGTHGRSIWIMDVSLLRGISERDVDKDVVLYEPNNAIRWRRGDSRGASGTRRFVGENPASGVGLFYSLDRSAKELSLVITDSAGEVVREFPDVETGKGLHHVHWDLRKGSSRESRQGGRRFRRGGSVAVGTYKVVLTVGEETFEESFEVRNDPGEPDTTWTEHEERWEELEAARAEEERESGSGGDIHD